MRFRNYMHHIAGSIEEWVQEEEAKYQADLLAKEVERHAKEMAEKEAAAEREAAATRESRLLLRVFFGDKQAGIVKMSIFARVREITRNSVSLASSEQKRKVSGRL